MNGSLLLLIQFCLEYDSIIMTYFKPQIARYYSELIRALKPDVLVKGGDYNVETVVGHEDMIASGGRVEIVPTVEGFSTTNIVKKLTATQEGSK